MTETLTLRFREAAAFINEKLALSTFRRMVKADPRLAACVVRFPGISDPYIHRGRLTEYVNALAEEQHPYYAAKTNAEKEAQKVSA